MGSVPSKLRGFKKKKQETPAQNNQDEQVSRSLSIIARIEKLVQEP